MLQLGYTYMEDFQHLIDMLTTKYDVYMFIFSFYSNHKVNSKYAMRESHEFQVVSSVQWTYIYLSKVFYKK